MIPLGKKSIRDHMFDRWHHEKMGLHHEKMGLHHEKMDMHHEKMDMHHEKMGLHHEKMSLAVLCFRRTGSSLYDNRSALFHQ
jgi:hypothetical protein